MSADKNKNLDLEESLLEKYSQAEDWFTKNRKPVLYGAGAIVVFLAGFLGYRFFVVEPNELEARNQIFKAQTLFEKDSFNLALNGNGSFTGFRELADNYGNTPTGNLAKYYAGICLMRSGQFEEAIDYLEDFSSNDLMVQAMAKGALGDCYVEINELEKGADYYLKAARSSDNEFSSPMYLKKAGQVYENLGQYSKAVDAYKLLREKYFSTSYGRDIDKFIQRAEQKQKNS